VVALDRQFYDVLQALVSPSGGSSATETALAAVTGTPRKGAYLAALIEEGWLDGAVEREPGGSVRAVFVRAISATGRTALAEKLARAAGQEGLATLGQLVQRVTGEVSPIDVVELERLMGCGLVRAGNPFTLTELGEFLLAEEARRPPPASTTIIQGVMNSQVAVSSSLIKGNVSITEQSLDRSDAVAAVEELRSRVVELELNQEARDEILADLATIRSQLDSPRPKRSIIHACAANVQAILQGAAGSAADVGLIEIVKRLMS
jgi:hypothetical protein